MCKRSINRKLQRYNIDKTPLQIVTEFCEKEGKTMSENQIKDLEKHYRQKEPEQFLAMYDKIREKEKD